VLDSANSLRLTYEADWRRGASRLLLRLNTMKGVGRGVSVRTFSHRATAFDPHLTFRFERASEDGASPNVTRPVYTTLRSSLRSVSHDCEVPGTCLAPSDPSGSGVGGVGCTSSHHTPLRGGVTGLGVWVPLDQATVRLQLCAR
jgi:hypothetical protein